MRPQQGFTLLELLIVLVIIGVVIAAVALSIQNSGSSQTSRSAANIFRARMLYAEELAVIQAMPIGVAISQQGYQFYQLPTTLEQSNDQWQSISTDPALQYQAWPKQMQLNLLLPNAPSVLIPDQLPAQPMLIFNSSGGVTPFTLQIDHFTISGQANGEISIE